MTGGRGWGAGWGEGGRWRLAPGGGSGARREGVGRFTACHDAPSPCQLKTINTLQKINRRTCGAPHCTQAARAAVDLSSLQSNQSCCRSLLIAVKPVLLHISPHCSQATAAAGLSSLQSSQCCTSLLIAVKPVLHISPHCSQASAAHLSSLQSSHSCCGSLLIAVKPVLHISPHCSQASADADLSSLQIFPHCRSVINPITPGAWQGSHWSDDF